MPKGFRPAFLDLKTGKHQQKHAVWEGKAASVLSLLLRSGRGGGRKAYASHLLPFRPVQVKIKESDGGRGGKKREPQFSALRIARTQKEGREEDPMKGARRRTFSKAQITKKCGTVEKRGREWEAPLEGARGRGQKNPSRGRSDLKPNKKRVGKDKKGE